MIKQTGIFLVLVLAAGCASKEKAPGPSVSPAKVRAEVDGWLKAHAQAEATKTHASGEHPAAQAEMDRRELTLRDMMQRDEVVVNRVFSEVHLRFQKEREEIIQRRNRIQIVGRTLTPEEKKFVGETAPRLLETISNLEKAVLLLLKSLKR